MANFFARLDPTFATDLQQLGRLNFELREHYNALLAPYGVADAAALLDGLRQGQWPEHPAYEHYLAAATLAALRERARRAMHPATAPATATPPVPHLDLAPHLETTFASDLDGPLDCKQDGLRIMLRNGLAVTVHYLADDAYSIRWQPRHAHTGDAGDRRDTPAAGIDTAPLHADLATCPNHLHLADGRIVADPLTRCGATPADNVGAVLRALLDGALVADGESGT